MYLYEYFPVQRKGVASESVAWDHMSVMVSKKRQPPNHREGWKHMEYGIKSVGLLVYHRQEHSTLMLFWHRQEEADGPIGQLQSYLWTSSVWCFTKWEPLRTERGEGNRWGVWKMYRTLGQVRMQWAVVIGLPLPLQWWHPPMLGQGCLHAAFVLCQAPSGLSPPCCTQCPICVHHSRCSPAKGNQGYRECSPRYGQPSSNMCLGLPRTMCRTWHLSVFYEIPVGLFLGTSKQWLCSQVYWLNPWFVSWVDVKRCFSFLLLEHW